MRCNHLEGEKKPNDDVFPISPLSKSIFFFSTNRLWNISEKMKRVLGGRNEVLAYRRPSHSGWENDRPSRVLFLKWGVVRSDVHGGAAVHLFLSAERACQRVSEGEWGIGGAARTAERVHSFFLLSTLQPRADVSDSCGGSACALHGLWDIFGVLTFLNDTSLICSVPSKWLISTCPTLSRWFSVDDVGTVSILQKDKQNIYI